MKPDVRVLCKEDEVGHPVTVRAELFVFRFKAPVVGYRHGARAAKGKLLLFSEDVEALEKAGDIVCEEVTPVAIDVLELSLEGMGNLNGGTAE